MKDHRAHLSKLDRSTDTAAAWFDYHQACFADIDELLQSSEVIKKALDEDGVLRKRLTEDIVRYFLPL